MVAKLERLAEADPKVRALVGQLAREVSNTHPSDYPAMVARHVAVVRRLTHFEELSHRVADLHADREISRCMALLPARPETKQALDARAERLSARARQEAFVSTLTVAIAAGAT
ncbi:MAG: hypothetical protein ACLPJH_15990 [Myxococcaceae bacterium]